jgi:outer membrane protein
MTRAVLAGLALAAAAPAAAQTPAPAPARIAFVSFRDVLQRTPGYAAAESTFAREVEAYRQEVAQLQQQMDSAVQAFDQQSIALSPAARTAKQRELQQMQARIEQRGGELQQRAAERERELIQPIQARVGSVIQGIRAEMNLSLILDTGAANGVLAYDPALDLTARVLERLQRAQ